MAIPLLVGLTSAARIAYPLIKAGVARGMSANAIGRSLKAAKLGIRRQVLLDIVRGELGIQTLGKKLRNVGLNKVINVARLPPALHKIRRQYSFVVRVAGRSLDTGLEVVQNISVSTDTTLTRRELQRIAEQTVVDNQDEYEILIDGSMLIEGMQAGDKGVL